MATLKCPLGHEADIGEFRLLPVATQWTQRKGTENYHPTVVTVRICPYCGTVFLENPKLAL